MLRYLNTDLDLTAAGDLRPLAESLESRGLFALHVERALDGTWHARFETEHQHGEPESNIAAMVEILEKMTDRERASWAACSIRDLDIGYEYEPEQRASDFGISADLLARVAALGASLHVTLYGATD